MLVYHSQKWGAPRCSLRISRGFCRFLGCHSITLFCLFFFHVFLHLGPRFGNVLHKRSSANDQWLLNCYSLPLATITHFLSGKGALNMNHKNEWQTQFSKLGRYRSLDPPYSVVTVRPLHSVFEHQLDTCWTHHALPCINSLKIQRNKLFTICISDL